MGAYLRLDLTGLDTATLQVKSAGKISRVLQCKLFWTALSRPT